MTSYSELFVTEEVRYEVERILKGKGISEPGFTIDIPKDWMGIEHMSNFPDEGLSPIVIPGGEVIGYVKWKIKFNIEKDITSSMNKIRSIEALPVITRIDIGDETVYVKDKVEKLKSDTIEPSGDLADDILAVCRRGERIKAKIEAMKSEELEQIYKKYNKELRKIPEWRDRVIGDIKKKYEEEKEE